MVSIMDRVVMMQFGAKGNTLAHQFLQGQGASPKGEAKQIEGYVSRGKMARVFIPLKEEDRVLMFEDNSGVYVAKDGFCSPMDSDISHEVIQWQEV